jgi:hypothetical protein
MSQYVLIPTPCLTLLPPELFVHLTTEPEEEWMDLEKRVGEAQKRFRSLMRKWEKMHHL